MIKTGKLKGKIEKDLYVRYNMNPNLWRNSERNYFPYNVPLEIIVGTPLVLPLVFLIYVLGIRDTNYSLL